MPYRVSIRALLQRLVLAVALPLAALSAWGLYDAVQDHQRQAREQVFNLAQVTASQTANFLGQARNILNGLAARPAVRALDPARCDPILKDFLGLAPRFANAVTMRLDATVVCSAAPLGGLARGNPERFIKLLRGPDQLTMGKPAPGVITGRWVLPVGRPLLSARGEIDGAVALPLDLLTLPVLPSVKGLAENAVVGLIDGEGTVLARSSEAQRFVGTKAGAGRTAQREKSGTAEVMGIDGIARIQGFAPVPDTDWIAVASVPASAVYGGVMTRVRTSALIAVAILCAALLLALNLGRRIHEPVAALAGAAREVAAGNLAARAPIAGAAEIAEVAAQFNRMLDVRAHAEAVLHQSEEKLRLFVDFAPSAIAMFDREMRYVAYSRRWIADYDLADRDLTGRSHYEVFPDLPERWKEIHRKCMAGAVERADEDPFPRSDGSMDWVRWEARPWYGAGGGIGGLIIFSEVVTDRKHAEAARIAAAERFEKVFRAAPVPMTITQEKTGVLADVNDAFCALFGCSREEAIGRTTIGLGLWIDPADREAMTACLRASPRVRNFEARRRTRSGEARDVTINTDRIELEGEPCILATLYDVTARRAAERQLRETHDRFQKLFHAAPLPIVVSSLAEGRLVEVNDAYCALIGRTRDALIGRAVPELGIWSDPGERAALVERLRLQPHVKDLEVHIRDSAGNVRDVLMSVESVHYLGEPCMLQIGVDITERKRAERELRQLIDNLFSFVGVLTPEGIMIEANRTALRAADLRLEDVLGKPVEDSYWVSYSEASRTRMREVVQRAAAGESVRQDIEIRIAQGALITIDLALVPVRERGGHVTKLVASGIDITERKRAEVGLRQAQRLAKLGYAITRSDSAIENPSDSLARLIGVEPGQTPKSVREWLTLLHPEDRALFRDKAIEAGKTGMPWDIEYRLRRGDGAWVDFRHVIEPLEGATGAEGGTRWFNMVQDVTEQKRAAAALRESRASLQALARRLLEVQETERRFLARELHDEVGGVLTAVKLNLQSLGATRGQGAGKEAVVDALALVDGAIQSVRSLSLDLRPAVLDDLGLIPALKWYCERQAQRTGVAIELALEAIDLKSAPQLESACFRIAQESVTNALRHANARRIRIALGRRDGGLLLEITDDGRGFQPAAARQHALAGGSAGLLGMEERAKLLGGRFVVESAPGAGARVSVEFAMPEEGLA